MKATRMKEVKKNMFSLRPSFTLGVLILLVFVLFYSLEAKGKTALRGKVDQIVLQVAGRHRVPPVLVHSIIHHESNYNSRAISPKGAKGLMQLMPQTAKEYGVKNVYDAKDNIEGGVKYLKDLIKLYRGKTSLVLAAYNAGQEAIKKYGGIPPYPETRNYIKKIMASYPKSIIKTRSKIYEFYDHSGKLVLTNTPYYFSIRKSQSD